MTDAEFSAELLSLYVRAQNRMAEEPNDNYWPMVADALKIAVVACGHAQMADPRHMPHLHPITIPLREFKALEPLTKGVKG